MYSTRKVLMLMNKVIFNYKNYTEQKASLGDIFRVTDSSYESQLFMLCGGPEACLMALTGTFVGKIDSIMISDITNELKNVYDQVEYIGPCNITVEQID